MPLITKNRIVFLYIWEVHWSREYRSEDWKTFLHSCGSDVAFLDDFIGTPEDVKKEVENNMFVFNNVHNIQATALIDNLIAMFETVKK